MTKGFLSYLKGGIIIFTSLMVQGCATYYQKNLKFQAHFSRGEFEEAHKVLSKNKKAATKKDRLLYFLNKGTLLQLMDSFKQSNNSFEQAYIFHEDYKKNKVKDAVTSLTNPNLRAYNGEDFEMVLLHFFKTINFLKLHDYEAALVETRRINIKLNELDDKYGHKKNRYKHDAFAHNLMGIIYDISREYNNAFIAYKNAYEAYKEGFGKSFNVDCPFQLKDDLLRMAYLNGFKEELRKFEKEFNTKYEHQKNDGGELIFFWQNGLGPVKDEWSINFVVSPDHKNGLVHFDNLDLGLNFSFPIEKKENYEEADNNYLNGLKLVRVAFPKYLQRQPFYNQSSLEVNNNKYKVELAENINEIAVKSLEDRMLRELGVSLMRLAFKQAAAISASKQNEGLGALISLAGAITEKSDTRNWQTLPYSISYSRVPLDIGKNQVKFTIGSENQSKEVNFNFEVKKGQTVFHTFRNFESSPPR